MSVISPPTGVCNGALIRWSFEILNTRDVQPLRALWTDATLERFGVYDQMQFARQAGMLAPDGSAGDRATKAAFNAKTRLLARLRGRRRR